MEKRIAAKKDEITRGWSSANPGERARMRRALAALDRLDLFYSRRGKVPEPPAPPQPPVKPAAVSSGNGREPAISFTDADLEVKSAERDEAIQRAADAIREAAERIAIS